MSARTSGARVVMLIDADNVSADVMQQALHHVIAEHGACHVRRAYCTPETAVKQRQLFAELSIRPMVNLAAGKNSTDIALAVDALDLVAAERPDVAVIVSSDSDFSPLVLRLREKGCRVCGIGQAGKTGDEVRGVYDEFVDLQHRKGRAADKSAAQGGHAREAAPKKAAKESAKESARESARELARAPAKESAKESTKGAAKEAGARRGSRSAKAAPRPALPADVERLLDAVPALRDGGKLELNVAAEALRAAGLLTRSGSSTKLFRKHPDHFALSPEKQPNKVQFRVPA